MEQLKVRQEQFAATFNLTYDNLQLLNKAYNTEGLLVCLALLKAKRYRSSNRKYLANRIRSWLNSEFRISSQPITMQQLDSIKPKWPINIVLPT